jgi:small subunit ribosomal protein S15
MARMHSKKRGKSRSRKPTAEESKSPEGISNEQLEEMIADYAKQGKSPAVIGGILKKEHGVPYIKHALGKPLTKVLKEKGIKSPIPYDLLDLMKKSVNMYEHLSKNRQDMNNKVRLQRIESKIWRLTKYYIRHGMLPRGWRYDPKQAELLIKGTS